MAREPAREIIERICNNDLCVVAPDVAEAAIVEIESAITTAQSTLAGEVLAMVALAIPCPDKDHDDRWCPTCSAQGDAQDVIESRLRDLFARKGITVGHSAGN